MVQCSDEMCACNLIACQKVTDEYINKISTKCTSQPNVKLSTEHTGTSNFSSLPPWRVNCNLANIKASALIIQIMSPYKFITTHKSFPSRTRNSPCWSNILSTHLKLNFFYPQRSHGAYCTPKWPKFNVIIIKLWIKYYY